MRLLKARITNHRSVEDSEEFSVDDTRRLRSSFALTFMRSDWRVTQPGPGNC